MKRANQRLKLAFMFLLLLVSIFGAFSSNAYHVAQAKMPFYDLKPSFLRVRSEFYTSYGSSTDDRKSNIATAVSTLNNTFVDVGGEFSFNRTIGPRTQKRGYKSAKIIVGGKFVDGVGGGVCQVSTTLYNAVLLSGLKVTEYHAHSLPVSYVAPSFDAMVNSGSADLRFINNTHNPLIILAYADGQTLKIKILGEPMQEKYIRQSTITEYFDAPSEEVVFDEKGEYPDLYEGERKTITWAKQGYLSEGVLVKTINGKEISRKRIRKDKYNAVRGVVVEGRAKRPEIESDIRGGQDNLDCDYREIAN